MPVHPSPATTYSLYALVNVTKSGKTGLIVIKSESTECRKRPLVVTASGLISQSLSKM